MVTTQHITPALCTSGTKPCTVTYDGWHCCLINDHVGAREAWTGTHPLRRAYAWPNGS